MKFALPIALGLALAVCAHAQAQSDPASSSTGPAPSSASPTPTSSSSSTSAAPSSSATSAPSGDNDGAQSSGVCSVLVGNPTVRAFDCTYSSTSTPPYDASSIQSYLIGGYSPNQGEEVGQVATDLAESVLRYYPTMTASVSQIASEFEDAINRSIQNYRKPDGANLVAPRNLGAVALAGAAAVAGAAFIL